MKPFSFFAVVILAIAAVLPTKAAPAAPAAADAIMKEALKKAASEKKKIFLIFSATGCTWCEVLKGFLDSAEIKPIFNKYFVPVTLTTGEDENTNPGAAEYEKKYGPTEGTPYHAFLSADGKEIVDSLENGTGSNIGYPYTLEEIAWFMTMLKKAAPTMSARELSTIETKLKSYKQE